MVINFVIIERSGGSKEKIERGKKKEHRGEVGQIPPPPSAIKLSYMKREIWTGFSG